MYVEVFRRAPLVALDHLLLGGGRWFQRQSGDARGTRVKLLVYDGFGVWCAARRLNAGRFVWPSTTDATPLLSLTPAQFDALVLNPPWQRPPELSVITRA